MTPFREWRWTHWVLIIGIFLLLLLTSVLVYALLQPQVFTPAPPPSDQEPPLGSLPAPIAGTPTFPRSPIEDVPLSALQGRNITEPVDLFARGDITFLQAVTTQPVSFVGSGPANRGLNFYDPQQRRFMRIDSNGDVVHVSSRIFAEVENVTYAPNANDSIVEFPDGSNILYNFETEEQVTLPSHWQDFDFAPNSESIAFKSLPLDPNQNWLAISEKDGNQSRQIAFLGDNEDIVDVNWSPNNQVVATYWRPNGLTQSELYFVGFNQENFPLSNIHGLNVEATWTPQGNQLLYSASHQDNDFKPRLWLVDGSGQSMGQNRRSVPLETWTHKCAFANATTVYCGVPVELPRGAGIIPAVADDIEDEIYRVDLQTGSVSRIAIPLENIHVNQLVVSEEEDVIYIHDGFTNQVKALNLVPQL